MKQSVLTILFLLLVATSYSNEQSVANPNRQDRGVMNGEIDSLKFIVKPYYLNRPDGRPGREISLAFNTHYFSGTGNIEVECLGDKETIEVDFNKASSEISLLLPYGAGVKSDCKAKITVNTSKQNITRVVHIPALRHWTVFIYPHSHVDIGYTNTHKNVEIIHTRNIANGLELANNTKNNPEASRYLWNPEVIWPFDMYLKKATSEERKAAIESVKEGYLHLDAGYVNLNTSLAGEEELLEFFRPAHEYEKMTGKKIETLVQVDIPGMSWGIVPVAAKMGVKYIFTFNNGSDRVGHSVDHGFKPFWWADAQGKNKVLYLQAGSYTPGALVKGKYYWPKMAGQTDPSKLIEIVKTDNPRENFIDEYLNQILPELEQSDYYPYDIFPMSWAMADNTPIDADLPEAVKSWNAEYAYPKLIIASATEIMQTFDEKYGDQLPVKKGDFTEYWTDGAGTAARQTAMNRTSKERLVQAETLWTMLNTGKAAPRNKFNEAWRNILMGSEHTWCYMSPDQEPINSDILKVKFNYFQQGEDMSLSLLSDAVSEVMNDESAVFAVFNNLSWSRDGIVTIPAKQTGDFDAVFEEGGKRVISQRLSTGELVFHTSDVPAFGSKKYLLKKRKPAYRGGLVKDNLLDNGIIQVKVDPKSGEVSNYIYDGVEYADQHAKCALNSYRYLKGDDTPDKALKPTDVKIRVKEDGPLLATLAIESQAEGTRKLLSEITIFKGQSYLDIKNTVDKIATKDKEGIHFGYAFNISNPRVVADIPWGTMEVEKEQLQGANRNWITLQRWLNVSNDKVGMTWCPLDAPVFQVGEITANILGAATKSEKWIKKLEPDGTIYSWALNNHWHTNFQLSQGGLITFRYRLQPHTTGYDYAASNRFALEQYQPLVATPVETDFKAGRLLSIEGSPQVSATVFKTSSDGKYALLRLRSLSDLDETVSLIWFDRKPSSVHTLDIEDDKPLKEIQDQVTVPAKDFVTLKVNW